MINRRLKCFNDKNKTKNKAATTTTNNNKIKKTTTTKTNKTTTTKHPPTKPNGLLTAIEFRPDQALVERLHHWASGKEFQERQFRGTSLYTPVCMIHV